MFSRLVAGVSAILIGFLGVYSVAADHDDRYYYSSSYSRGDCADAQYLARKGIIRDRSNCSGYRLRDNILRQEAAAVAYEVGVYCDNISGYRDDYRRYFKDVSRSYPNNWAYRPIEALAYAGYISTTRDHFRPERKITNAEMLAMLMSAGEIYYPRSSSANWQNSLINHAYREDIIESYWTNPNSYARRGLVFETAREIIRECGDDRYDDDYDYRYDDDYDRYDYYDHDYRYGDYDRYYDQYVDDCDDYRYDDDCDRYDDDYYRYDYQDYYDYDDHRRYDDDYYRYDDYRYDDRYDYYDHNHSYDYDRYDDLFDRYDYEDRYYRYSYDRDEDGDVHVDVDVNIEDDEDDDDQSVDDEPNARDDSAMTNENTAITISVLNNDTDPQNDIDPTTVSVRSGPFSGTASANSSGTVTYTPNTGFSGSDVFTYRVCDDEDNCDTATVTISIQNTTPMAVDDMATTDEDTPVDIDVAANDNDGNANLDLTSVSVTSGPFNGTASAHATTGVITYIPNADYHGSDILSYRICDTTSLCDTATVSITIHAINDTPIAMDDAATTPEDTSVTIDVIANDSDADGNTTLDTAITITASPSNGTAVVSSGGTISYTPNANFSGSDSLTYQVCDTYSSPACDTATVTITISAVNDTPVAADDSATTTVDTAIAINVLANDTDVENDIDEASVTITTAPTNGTITSINTTTGEITYTPNAAFTGTDTFTYQVCDSDPSSCDTADVTVTTS